MTDETHPPTCGTCEATQPEPHAPDCPEANFRSRAPEGGGEQAQERCPGCRDGQEPVLLDEHGTLSSVSGLPGKPGHAVDDYFWWCDQYREAVEEGYRRASEENGPERECEECEVWQDKLHALIHEQDEEAAELRAAFGIKIGSPPYSLKEQLFAVAARLRAAPPPVSKGGTEQEPDTIPDAWVPAVKEIIDAACRLSKQDGSAQAAVFAIIARLRASGSPGPETEGEHALRQELCSGLGGACQYWRGHDGECSPGPTERPAPDAWKVRDVIDGKPRPWKLSFQGPYPTEPGKLWHLGKEYYQEGVPLYEHALARPSVDARKALEEIVEGAPAEGGTVCSYCYDRLPGKHQPGCPAEIARRALAYEGSTDDG